METDPDQIRQRHERLLARLRDAAASAGHDPARLRIVGVTKGWPVEVALAASRAGVASLGESRVQEAEPKVAALPDVDWHLVGRLQSNKVRRAVRLFAAIHSVDSVDLLRRIVEIGAEEGRRPALLLQVNVGEEASKAGFPTGVVLGREVVELAREAGVVGLMTIAPMGVTTDAARAVFRRLREERDRLAERIGAPLPELSMGMSDDAEAAAAEGATLVRIGTALFGPRH